MVELGDVQKADGNKKSTTVTHLSFMVTISKQPEYFQCARVGRRLCVWVGGGGEYRPL